MALRMKERSDGAYQRSSWSPEEDMDWYGNSIRENSRDTRKSCKRAKTIQTIPYWTRGSTRSIPKLKYKQFLDKEEFDLSKKLQYRYDGPFVINEMISPITRRILKDDENLHTVAFKNLKPYRIDSKKPVRTNRTNNLEWIFPSCFNTFSTLDSYFSTYLYSRFNLRGLGVMQWRILKYSAILVKIS